MEHSELLAAVRGPLSPDARLEVPVSQPSTSEYKKCLTRKKPKYLWYDSIRNVAIVVARRTPLHGRMAGAGLSICADVLTKSGISSEITRTLVSDSESSTNMQAWDGALQCHHGNRLALMIAVEVRASLSYDSLQAAISWSVWALRCLLSLALSISKASRGETPRTRHYASIEGANAAAEDAEDAEDDFYGQRMQYTYGPLESYGVTWFGRDEESMPETLLKTSQSIVSDELLTSCVIHV
ncbi:hypothetical protein V1521DRAFT_463154 [Lipomyces starkeyi]